jgi:hypothetical protein
MILFRRHVSDRNLLLALDRELPARHAARIADHLTRCAGCFERMARLKEVSTDVGRVYRDEPSHAMPGDLRARLRIQLAEQVRSGGGAEETNGWRPAFTAAALASVCAALVLGVAGGRWLVNPGHVPARATTGLIEAGVLPLAHLTPGATRPVALHEVCQDEDRSLVVPAVVRQQVLLAYHMLDVPAGEYELDYLITPELGGTADPRNLWPERYSSAVWNARVKDELEDLLPRLVCEGTVALATAQRDMATNWIDAYRKYFRTEGPRRIHTHRSRPDRAVSAGYRPVRVALVERGDRFALRRSWWFDSGPDWR